MAWESRARGGRYYTRSRRVEGRVVREYVGCGIAGELAAQADQEARRIQETIRAAERAERKALEDIEQVLVSYNRAADGLTAGVLSNAGYHRTTEESGDMEELARLDDIDALATTASKGDRSVLEVLRKAICDTDNGLWTEIGNLTLWVQNELIDMMFAKEELLAREAVKAKLAELVSELAGPSPSPLERLLVERIATCWLDVQEADRRYLKAAKGQGSFALGEYYQRRQDRAHKRLLTAIKTLAQVRKLGGAVVQVNVAEQQINVAQSNG